MSYVGLSDETDGIHVNIFDSPLDSNAPNGFTFRNTDAEVLLDRTTAHTVRFLIELVPGENNDIVRIFIDNVDIGDKLDVCFTTWENYYRLSPEQTIQTTTHRRISIASSSVRVPAVRRQLLLRAFSVAATCSTTYRPTTRATNGPEPTVCGVPEVGVIAPTATTCQMYRDRATTPVPVLGALQYTTTKGGSINAVSPGVFFYYTEVSGDAGDLVEVTQTNNGTPAPYAAIPVMQGQTVLYNASTCAKVKWGPGFTLPSPGGDYIIGVKYDASSLKGKAPSTSQPVTYSFETTVGGDLVDTGASVLLAKK